MKKTNYGMTKKTRRLLNVLAIILKDQDKKVIQDVSETVSELYPHANYDFKAACETAKIQVQG